MTKSTKSTGLSARIRHSCLRSFVAAVCFIFSAFHSLAASAQASVEIVGVYSYAIPASSGLVELHVDQILNASSTYTTGTLRLELWATTSVYSGGNISGYRIATQQISTNNGVLGPNQSFFNVNGTSPLLSTPPPGTYYASLLITEFTSGCSSSDGFCIDTFGAFANAVVVGVSGAAPSCTVNVAPTSLPSAGGTVNYQATCAASPTSYSWSVNGQVQPNSASSGSIFIPANSSPTALSYLFSVVATNASGASPAASGTVTQAGSVTSPAVKLGGYMSGNWFMPSQGGGQGFQLEFTNANNDMIAIWFAYTPAGSAANDGGGQNWIYSEGGYDTTKSTVTLPAVLFAGARFPPNFHAGDVHRVPSDASTWGTITFSFTDCNNGTVSWHSTLAGYNLENDTPLAIQRLTQIAGTTCPQ